MNFLLYPSVVVVLASGLASQPGGVPANSATINGSWLGVISAGVQEMRVGLIVEEVPGKGYAAKFRAIDPKVTERDVETIEFDGVELRFILAKPSVKYAGRVEGEPPAIVGAWTQRGVEYPIRFERVDALPASKRSQEPERPLLYHEEDVRIETASKEISLAGTLTCPKSDGKHAVFILISGSGPQDRDETMYGHKPFLVLADSLTRGGFAVLRFDDRGVGGSTGDVFQATLDDLAGDVIAAAEYLRDRPDIDSKRIGLIGHSEGGLVAAMAAGRSKNFDRIALLGTPGLPFRELRRLQTESLGKSLGASDAAIEGIRSFNAAVFDAIDAGHTDEQLRAVLDTEGERFLDELPEHDRNHYRGLARELVQTGIGMQTPWFRSLLALDTAAIVSRVECRVLALIGEQDVQVPFAPNVAALREALVQGPSRDARVISLPAINHMLQTCRTGALSEYIGIEETVSPEVLRLIGAWAAE